MSKEKEDTECMEAERGGKVGLRGDGTTAPPPRSEKLVLVAKP